MDTAVETKPEQRLVRSDGGSVYVDDGKGGVTGTSVYNVPGLKQLIKQCEDIPLLTQLALEEGRQGVKKAAKTRIAQLEAEPVDDTTCTIKVGDGPEVPFDSDNPSPEAKAELERAVTENMPDVIAAEDDGTVAFDLDDVSYTAEISSVKLPPVRQDGFVIDQICTMVADLKATPSNLQSSEFFPCAFQMLDAPEVELDDEEARQEDIEGESESEVIREPTGPPVLPNPGGTQRVGETDYEYNVEVTHVETGTKHLLEPRGITWLAVTPDSDKQNTHPMATLTLKLDKMPHTVGSLEKWVMGKWLVRFVKKPEQQQNDEHNKTSKEKNPGQALIEEGISEADRTAHDAAVQNFWDDLTQDEYQEAIDFADEEIDEEQLKKRLDEKLPEYGAFSLGNIMASFSDEELQVKADSAKCPVDRFIWKAWALVIKRTQEAGANHTHEEADG